MADVRLTATNPEDSSVVPVACDASGRLLLEEQGQGPQGEQGPQGPKGDDGDPFSGNFADDVTFGGSASFADEIKVEGSNTPSGKWSGISKYGSLLIGTTSEAVSDATVSIDSSSGLLKSDGSAEFAGQVYGSGFLADTPNNSGSIVFRGKNQDGTTTSTVRANGSAEFAGEVSADTGAFSRDVDNDNVTILYGGNDNGVKFAVKGNGTYIGSSLTSINNVIPTGSNIALKSDGTATFAGGKAGFTAEGYLWCTTVRGDTVMLDATSNGMGVWVEYSVTTRIDEIRDRLDANRGDTGEMPADTP